MNKKDLEKLGLTAEVIKTAGLSEDTLDKIIIEHGKDIESHKTKLTAAEAERDTVRTQLEDASKTIKIFNGMTPEQVKQTSEEWKVKHDQAVADGESKVKQLKQQHALEAALQAENVHDVADILPHLKMDKIVFDDDGRPTAGLTEQLTPLKESKKYLFKDPSAETDPTIEFSSGSQRSQGLGVDAFDAAMVKGAGLPPDTKL